MSYFDQADIDKIKSFLSAMDDDGFPSRKLLSMRDARVKEMVQLLKEGKGGLVLCELLRYLNRPYPDFSDPIRDYRIFLLALVCRFNVNSSPQRLVGVVCLIRPV